MKEVGYELCDSDDAETSYILAFSADSKWVTITSEEYEHNNKLAQNDAGRIAGMMNTFCINTSVIDSDCAIMDLYDENGSKADSLIMGRADDYFGDNIPEPSKRIWSQFLTEGNTFEQLSEVQSRNYVFVENGVIRLADLIGIDRRDILFSANEAQEDEQTVFLYFKKATAKSEIRISYNAAFHQVFGKALEPLGYKRLKGKYPYYVKCINGEILHIIALASKKWSETTDSISVVGGVATIYRKKIKFPNNPRDEFPDLGIFYENHRSADFDKEYRWNLYNGYILVNSSSKTILEHMEWLLSQEKKWMLPEIESAVDISSTIKYLIHYQNGNLGIYLPGHRLFKFGIINESILFFLHENIPELEYEYTNYYNRIKRY